MNPSFATTVVSQNLLHEVAHSTVTMEPVLFFYGAVIVAAAVLWTIGVLAFGRSGAPSVAEPSTHSSPRRITHAVL